MQLIVATYFFLLTIFYYYLKIKIYIEVQIVYDGKINLADCTIIGCRKTLRVFFCFVCLFVFVVAQQRIMLENLGLLFFFVDFRNLKLVQTYIFV